MTVTGDKTGAGTNANVFMTLYGKTGTTKKIHLKNNTKSSFQSGSTDTFHFKSNCVGPMMKLRIEHDNTGLAPGWYLERVSWKVSVHLTGVVKKSLLILQRLLTKYCP